MTTTPTTRSVTSADGTTIGYEVLGRGSPLLAVHGGTADRSRWAVVAPQLAERHEVWLVDRRGRGLSGDAPDHGYDLEREADDLVALVDAAGPGAVVLAHSAGATIALQAAPRLAGIAGLALYEPAFGTPGNPVVDEVTFAAFEQLLDAGDREAALSLFFSRVIGLPAPAIDAMRATPVWQARLDAVHTLTREGRAIGAFRLDPGGLADLPYPVLLIAGTESPTFLRASTASAHAAITGSTYVSLDGQAHMAMDTAPELFVRTVLTWLRDTSGLRPQ